MKYKILGIVNILLGFLLLVPLLAIAVVAIIFDDIHLSSFMFLVLFALLFPFTVNLFISYKALKRPKIIPFYLYLALTFSTVVWYLFLLRGLELNQPSAVFDILLIPTICALFYALTKLSLQTALKLFVVTLLVSLSILLVTFQLEYCLKQDTMTRGYCHATFNLRDALEKSNRLFK